VRHGRGTLFYVPEGGEAARRRRQWGAIDDHQLLEEGEAEVANKGGGRGEGTADRAPTMVRELGGGLGQRGSTRRRRWFSGGARKEEVG
jgi:hypothetical protein